MNRKQLWLAAESAVLMVTAVLVIVALASRGARFGDVTLRRLRFGLWMLDLKGGR
jgi:hypothetical protein